MGSYVGRNDAIGVSNDTATFVDLLAKLDYIRSLGFNAIELLPITDFLCDVGGAGEGYGPSDLFASEDAYATSPEKAVSELIQLIDAAHSKGLAVILDLVYNHAATQNNRYWRYDGNSAGDPSQGQGWRHLLCGMGIPRRGVRVSLSGNKKSKICCWTMLACIMTDYLGDGLRFDAVQAIPSDAIRYIVQELRREFPRQVSDRRIQPLRRRFRCIPSCRSLWDAGIQCNVGSEQPLGYLFPH